MIIGPKYKIARRLGAPIFEKTQTQKYALRQERKGRKQGFSKPKSEFGIQLNEKQKARFVYGMSERQFSNYVKEALLKKTSNSSQTIFGFLEKRLDNVVYRLGFGKTRPQARQMVSHRHVMVNGKKINIPSYTVGEGDKITITPKFQNEEIKARLEEGVEVPEFVTRQDLEGKLVRLPTREDVSNPVNYQLVIEFYSR